MPTSTDDQASKEPEMIAVLVVDNHPILREGLALILDNQIDMKVVAQGSDGEEAVQLYGQCKPDVAILDLRMLNMNGVEATIEILSRDPLARILILTTFDGDQEIQRALRAGVKGYVLKDSPRADLLHAIRSVYRGERYLSPSVGGKLADTLGLQPLTKRERSVLALLVQGRSNKSIAAELEVTEGTVKTHVNSVRQKLGVSSRTEAALAAMRRGLVQAD